MREAVNLNNVQIVQLNSGNFNKNSLDHFVLKHHVTKCWRKVKGEYKLLPVCYVEE